MDSKFGQDPVSGARWEIRGPAEGPPLVEAWADGYIPFEPSQTSWKRVLRDEIRSRCQLLEPPAGEVLHATFFGGMPPRSDVENLVLYNIDNSFRSFKSSGRNGIRFEHGTEVPSLDLGGAPYPFGYRYTFAPCDDFVGRPASAWKRGRTLASFDWTDLGAFAGEKKLAQVWLSLARGDAEPIAPAVAPGSKFAVQVQVRPPRGKQWVLGKLVKPIFDGVICAFQAHTDTAVLPEVLPRLAEYLPAQSEEITNLLLDQRRAVLGAVNRLVAPYRSGVKWYPSDDLCMIGELLPVEPTNDRWAIKGNVVEVSC